MRALATVSTRRELCRRAVAQAARSPEGLALAFLAPVVAIALASWWVLGAGAAGYLAILLRRLFDPEVWRQAASQRERLPEPGTIPDPEVRSAVSAIREAERKLVEARAQCPPALVRVFDGAIESLERLAPSVLALVHQAEATTRWLNLASMDRVRLEASSFEHRARSAGGARTRQQYEAARQSRAETLRTLEQLADARAAGIAALWRIAAALEGIPTRMVWLDLLGEQAKGDPVTAVESLLGELDHDTRVIETAVRGALGSAGS